MMYLVRLALGVALPCLVLLPNAALANRKPCLNLEQSYEQIKRGASTIEINNVLFKAADKGCQALAVQLLDNGASLKARDRVGSQPLAHAAAAGKADIVTLFLDRGAAIDAQNIDGSTALYKAAEAGRLDIVKLLVERGRM